MPKKAGEKTKSQERVKSPRLGFWLKGRDGGAADNFFLGWVLAVC